MLTIFDGSNGYPISQDDYYIRELASGYDEVIFHVNIRDDIYRFVKEEAVIRDRNQNVYLVKQIDAGENSAKVVAQINLDDWKAQLYMDYSNNSATVLQTVQSVLPTGWSVIDYSLVTKKRTIPTSDTTGDYNVTALKVLEDCVSVYEVRFRFNTADKIVYIINPANYASRGAFATRDLNLKKLNYKGKSDDFVTRLYAEGADGLTFASINDGKAYVENFNYANKVICAFWKDERYTDAESLLEDAQAKVDAMAIPSQSYDCDVLDLANTNPDMYGFEDFSLFEVVTLIDDAKNTRTDYQVVERWTYPYYPVNNKVMLSSSTPNIQSAIATVVNSIGSSTSAFQQMMMSAIANATSLITGNSGGYLVLHDSNGDGTPDELLIMNTASIETATKIWRWNQAGLGYSSNGYEGPYDIGITMDGAIVANFITSGQLNGDIIQAGTIQTSALSVEAQEECIGIHNYIPYDYLSNVGRYTGKAGYTFPYFTTIGGKTYVAIDADGVTSVTAGDAAKVPSDFLGKPTLNISFKLRFSKQYTCSANERIFGYGYYDKSGTYREQWRQWSSVQTFNAGEDYSFSYTTTPNYDALSDQRIIFYYHPDVIVYFTDVKVETTEAVYNTASLSVSAGGLSSIVQSGSIISSINQSAESVSINASRINLTGALSLNGDFHCYNANDRSDFAYLNDGNLSFYNNGINVFTIASTALLGSYAGIFFGDVEDPSAMANYTFITQEKVTTPEVYIKGDGRFDTYAWPLVVEGDIRASFIEIEYLEVNGLGNRPCIFHGDVEFNNFSGGATATTQFYSTVLNSGGGTVFVSDKRKKRSIKDLVVDKARSFIMGLKPKKFKFTKDISNSDRYHHGFIAQEVKEIMGEDWGLYIHDEKRDFIGLRYDELIADLVAVVQDQQKRIEALERRVNDLTDN